MASETAAHSQALSSPKAKHLIQCRITVTGQTGRCAYNGIYSSTFDALIDAMVRFENTGAKISVRSLNGGAQ